MKLPFHSFYAQLSLLFLVLILGLGAFIAVLTVQSSFRYKDETEQKVNRGLAEQLAKEFQPLLVDSIAHEQIKNTIQRVTGINPHIEIYLLGSNGMIKAAYGAQGQRVEMITLDTEPLDRFLNGEPLPIQGPDPLMPDNQKTFSVAPISIMGENGCYLYVLLSSQRYESTAAMIRGSYIIQAALTSLILIVAITLFLGLILFRQLTARLRNVTSTVHAFEQGHYDRRLKEEGRDEIGQLSASFNRMADTIVSNMETLRSVDQLRRELIANVSHDLRGPLASMQGYLETILIRENVLSATERKMYLDIVLRNTRTLTTLVEQLFELSKLDAHQVQPQREAFSIAELVQDLVLQFQPRAQKAGVHLNAELPDHLSLVFADIALVERAISNLIENAVRYTPAGGEIRIVTGNQGDSVHLAVTDTGQGIPPEDLPYIFERFYRVDKSRAQEEGGTGLGLAITRKIIELHGSALCVHSVVNEGTTFSFGLPAWNASPALRPVEAI